MNDKYRESDFPYTLYFNGKRMPKWAGQWSWVLHDSFFSIPDKLWDEYIDLYHLYRIACRIDHVGVVESEDPIIFTVCAQALLKGMLINEQIIADDISIKYAGGTGAEVFSGVRDGLFEMIFLAKQNGYAFWSSGYQTDRDFLLNYIGKTKLPPTDPEYLDPPHIIDRRRELETRRKIQAKELRRLAQSGRFDKEIRKKLHQI